MQSMETFSRWLYLFFEEFEPTKDTLSLADSSGVRIQLSGPDNWTLGSFYQSNVSNPVATSSMWY